MPCGNFQDQRDVTGMIMTIPKKDTVPGYCLPVGKLLTAWDFWIKDVHRTEPSMEHAEFIMSKDSPMKDIGRSDIGGRGNMVVHACIVVNRGDKE